MQLLKNTTHFYGFEDYNIVPINANIFRQTWDFFPGYYYETRTGSYMINRDLPVELAEDAFSYYPTVTFKPSLCENHKELLDTAKKVYVHPCCKLSRSMMAEKYKKSLNPFLSDAVVVPEPDYRDFRLENQVLFINEIAKIIVRVVIYQDDEFSDILSAGFKDGDILKDKMTCAFIQRFNHIQYDINHVLESEFMYAGEVLFIPNSHSYALDILTNALPKDKIVFEKSVQESLSNETNQLTFDSLISVKDMIDSTDKNTVAAGLKALSMMDWMHYPNSIKFIMNQTDKYKWYYNDAMNSTSVKYMMNTIAKNVARRHFPGNYDDDIYEQDYELFKQLKMYYDKVSEDNILDYIRYCSFMSINSEGLLVPNLKKCV